MVSCNQFISFKKSSHSYEKLQDKLTKCLNGNLNYSKAKQVLEKLSTKLQEVQWIDRHLFLALLTNCRQGSPAENRKIQALGIKILLQSSLMGDEYKQVKSLRKEQKLTAHPELFMQTIIQDIKRFKHNIHNANFIDVLPKYYLAVAGLATDDKKLIDSMLNHYPLDRVIQLKGDVLELAAYVKSKQRKEHWVQSIVIYQTALGRAFTEEDCFGCTSFYQEVQKGILFHLTSFGASSELSKPEKKQLIEDLFYFYTNAPFYNKADELFEAINKNQGELGWQSIFAILHLMRELSEDSASKQFIGISDEARDVAKVLESMASLPKEDRCNIIDLAKKWFPDLLAGYACINIRKTFDILCLVWLLCSKDDRENVFGLTRYLFSFMKNNEIKTALEQTFIEISVILSGEKPMEMLDQLRPYFNADSQTVMIIKILDILSRAQHKSFYEANEVVELTRSLFEDIPAKSTPSIDEIYHMLTLVNELTPLQRQALIWHVIGVFWRLPTGAERIRLLEVFRSRGISAVKEIEAALG